MSSANAEEHIPINRIHENIPGCRPSRATVWRWVQDGIRGHRLESVMIGGRRYVTQDAINRWIEAINSAVKTPKVNIRSQRERNAKAAQDALKRKLNRIRSKRPAECSAIHETGSQQSDSEKDSDDLLALKQTD